MKLESKTDILRRLLDEKHITVDELITIMTEDNPSKFYIRIGEYAPPLTLEQFKKTTHYLP